MGAEFTKAGLSASDELISTTVPLNGASTSETAFTDSTVAAAAPGATPGRLPLIHMSRQELTSFLRDASVSAASEKNAEPDHPPSEISNTQAIGLVLYTRYVYFFQTAGLILLVAMIGAIVLTLQHKPNIKRQNIAKQVARNRASAIDVVKVKTGQGLS